MPCQATRTSLAVGTVFAVDLDVQHLYGTHSWPPLCEPWELQTTLPLPALWPEYGADKSTLMEHEFLLLPKDGHTLFHSGVIPQEMLQILYFMGGDPLHHNCEYGIFLLGSYSVHYMHVYTYVGSPCLDCSFLNLLMYPFIGLSHCQVMSINPFYSPYSDSIQDRLHNFCIQLWCNMAQSICNGTVSSFLVFNTKCESCQQFYPMMSSGI